MRHDSDLHEPNRLATDLAFHYKRWFCPINMKTRLSSAEMGTNFMLGAYGAPAL